MHRSTTMILHIAPPLIHTHISPTIYTYSILACDSYIQPYVHIYYIHSHVHPCIYPVTSQVPCCTLAILRSSSLPHSPPFTTVHAATSMTGSYA